MCVYKKLLAVQKTLKVPKNQKNNFGNYKYRSCEDILEALKIQLKENDALIYISDEIVLIGERHYVKATVTFIDVESGQSIVSTAYAREELTKKGMDGSQITGASSSYARKYALNGMFGIDDTKDSDATNLEVDNKQNDKQKDNQKETSKNLSEGQVKRLYFIGTKSGFSAEQINRRTKLKYKKDVSELSKAEYDETCECLEKNKPKNHLSVV